MLHLHMTRLNAKVLKPTRRDAYQSSMAWFRACITLSNTPLVMIVQKFGARLNSYRKNRGGRYELLFAKHPTMLNILPSGHSLTEGYR
jgi:hypothetical protein